VGQELLVLRTNNTLWVNVVAVAGTSAATPPAWPATPGALTPNGATLMFVNQGSPTLTPLPSWAPTTHFAAHARILDSNGNVEVLTLPAFGGFSGAGLPNWSTVIGHTTPDGPLTWINAGPLPSAALAAAGGTSGFIIDNVVGSGTQVGASQVYFSTLGPQACTGGTGGCAVQASQSGLQ
jgi:hypothetical protein